MKILIIEDDQNKLRQIKECLNEYFSTISIAEKYSYNTGLNALINSDYDLLILDMSMPTFDITPFETGGRPRIFGGKEILRQMKRKKINTPAIILTQFEKFGEKGKSISLKEVCKELECTYQNNYKGCVYYNAAQNNWRVELIKAIEKFSGRGEE